MASFMNLNAIVEVLDRQDILWINRNGLPEDVEAEVTKLCRHYQNAGLEDRSTIRSAITRHAMVVVQNFVSKMATVAMQQKDKDALDCGLIALDLSNIMKVDFRDAFHHVSQLTFAANECGIDVVAQVATLIPDASPRLLEMFSHPSPARIVRDTEGNRTFWSPWTKSQSRTAEE